MRSQTRKSLLLLLVVGVLIVGVGGTAVVARRAMVQRSVQQGYVEGKAAYAAREYEKAMRLLGPYVGRNEGDIETLLIYAECRSRVPKGEGGELVDAARVAERALARDPKNAKALEFLLGMYTRVRFITELNRVADVILESDPSHHAALSAKAQSQLALGKYDEAGAFAAKLAAIDPADPDPHRLILEIRRRQGDTAQKLAELAGQIAASYPSSFELAVIHAQTLLSAGDFKKSIEAVQAASKLTPTRLRGIADYLRVIDVLPLISRLSQNESAAQTLQDLRTGVPPIIESAFAQKEFGADAAAIAAGWEWRNFRFTQASAMLDRALAASPNSAAALAWKAVITRDQGGDWRPTAAAARAADNPDAPVWTGLLEAVEKIDERNWAEAASKLNASTQAAERVMAFPVTRADIEQERLRSNATQAFLLSGFYRGAIENSRGEWRQAVRHWLAASDAEPAWSLPVTYAADALAEHGLIESALEQAMRAVRIRNGASEALTLTRVLVAREERAPSSDEDIQRVWAMIDELEALSPLKPDALTLRARLAIAHSNEPQARAALAKIAQLDPPLESARLIGLARQMRAAKLTGWEQLLTTVEAREPANSDLILFRAADIASQSRTEEALTLLRQSAAKISPAEAVPFKLQEARTLASIGSSKEARELLNALSDQHEKEATVQSAVLEEPVIWADGALVEKAVERLRAATGDGGVEWRLADATRQLTFTPEEGRAQDAILSLNTALKADPANSRALALLGEWLLIVKDPVTAADHFARAVDAPDAEPTVFPRLIALLREQGRRADALTRLEQFARIEPLAPGLRRARATLFEEFSMRDRAMRDREALAALGGLQDAVEHARSLILAQQPSAAAPIVERLVADPALTRDQFVATALMLVEMGKADRALELLAGRSSSMTPWAVAFDRARILEFAGRLSDAEKSLRSGAEVHDQHEGFLELARFYLRQSRPDDARRAVAEARAKGFNVPELESADAIAAGMSQGTTTPEQQRSIIESLPQGPARDLAEATRWFDEHPTEREEFVGKLRAITKRAPGMLLAWQFLVRTLVESSRFDEAADAGREAASNLPDAADAARMATTTGLLASRLDQARIAANRWIELADHPLEPSVSLAQIELRSGNTDAARSILRGLVERCTPDAKTLPKEQWSSLVSIHAKLGETSTARKLADLRSTSDPDWAAESAWIAGTEATPIAEARAWIESLRPLLISSPTGVVSLAEALGHLGSRSKDLQDIKAAYELLEPRTKDASASAGELVLAAGMAEQLDRNSDAEALYRKAIEKSPTQWMAMNNLSYMLIESGSQLDEALSLAARASELAEKGGHGPAIRSRVLHTLAMAQLRTASAAEALVTVRSALSLDRSFPEARLTEVEALIATGDANRAKSALEALRREASVRAGALSPHDQKRADELQAKLAR